MGGCGSKSKAPTNSNQQEGFSDVDKALLDLKVQRDRLKKYQTNLNTVMERERTMAVQLLGEGKRDQALLCLKKRKYQQKLITQTNGMMLKLDRMVGDVEIAQVQREFYDTLKMGTAMLQKMNAEMKIEDVEELMLDNEEAIEHQKQISEMLAGSLSQDDVASVDNELDEMMREIGDEQAIEMKAAMPDVPTHADVAQITAEPVQVEGKMGSSIKQAMTEAL